MAKGVHTFKEGGSILLDMPNIGTVTYYDMNEAYEAVLLLPRQYVEVDTPGEEELRSALENIFFHNYAPGEEPIFKCWLQIMISSRLLTD